MIKSCHTGLEFSIIKYSLFGIDSQITTACLFIYFLDFYKLVPILISLCLDHLNQFSEGSSLIRKIGLR